MKKAIKKLLAKIPNLKFKKATKSTWERMEWEGIPEEFNREKRRHWEESDLEIPSKLEKKLKKLDNKAVDLINEFDDKLKKKHGYIDLVDYDKGHIVIVRPKDGKHLFESNTIEESSCPIRSGGSYGGIPTSGGYQSYTNYEVGLGRIAEALHCILGSLVRDMGNDTLASEIAHIEEEIGIVEKVMDDYGRKEITDQLSNGYYEPKYVEPSLKSIKKASDKLYKRADKKQKDLKKQDDLPKPVYKLADFTYEALKALASAAGRSVANGPPEHYQSAFNNKAFEEEIFWLKNAFKEYKSMSESKSSAGRLVESIQKLDNMPVLTELYVRGDEDDYEAVVAYRENVWVFDRDYIDRDIARHMKKELRISGALTDYHDVAQALEGKSDVLIGTVRRGELTLQGYGSFKFDPQSSILVKKVVKELGLRRVSYVGSDEEDYVSGSAELKGRIPDRMYHGTTSEHLRSILKKGIRPGESVSNYADQNVNHRDLVFFTTHKDKALYHASNASQKKGGMPVILEVEITDKAKIIPDYDVDVGAENAYYDHVPADTRDNQRKYGDAMKGSSMSLSREFGIFGYAGTVLPQKIETVFVPDDKNALSDFPKGSDFKPLSRKKALVWLELAFDMGEMVVGMSDDAIEQRLLDQKMREELGEPWITHEILDPWDDSRGWVEHEGSYVEIREAEYSDEFFDLGENGIPVDFHRCEFNRTSFEYEGEGVKFIGCEFDSCYFYVESTPDEIEMNGLSSLPMFQSMKNCEFEYCLIYADGDEIELDPTDLE